MEFLVWENPPGNPKFSDFAHDSYFQSSGITFFYCSQAHLMLILKSDNYFGC